MSKNNDIPKIIITSDDNPKYDLEFMKDKEVIIDENHIKVNSWTPPMIKLKEEDRGGS